MEDKNSVNVSKVHSSSERVLSPQPPEQGLVGRELDAAVAERVMGYSLVPRSVAIERDGCITIPTPDALDGGGVLHVEHFADDPYFITQYPDDPLHARMYAVHEFSTDIAAAMEVVEKMREKGFRWEALTPRGTGWRIRCFPADDAPDGYTQFRGLLPEAICRAALATVNVPEQEMETQKLG